MYALRHHEFDLANYFELELESSTKFEFCNGAILAMAGASPGHNTIVGNVMLALGRRLGAACRVMGSDQRIATADGVYTYPDGLVVCGALEVTEHRGTGTLHNPSVLVEVLSPSTRVYDLGEKLDHYKTIPSLNDVLLIEPDRVDVLHVRRRDTGWEPVRVSTLASTVTLAALKKPVPLKELYAHMTF